MGTIAQPASGVRVKKTIFTETLPAEQRSTEDAHPRPFYARDWETVVNELTAAEWENHLMRVYRADEKWDRASSPIDNTFSGPFTEEDMRARFGGGKYVLWLLGPPKKHNLVGKYQVTLDGPPLLNGTPRNGSTSDSNTVALEAMRMYANPEFVRMQMQMMVTAATEAMALIKSQMPAAQNPLETLRTAKEILGSPEPKDNLLDTIRVLKELGIVGSPEKKGIDEILGLITTLKTSGLIPSGAPKADLASTFAANLPMLADRFVTGLESMRLRAESEERGMRMQRGEMRPGDPNVITLDGKTPAPTQGASTATQPASSGVAGTAQPMDPATVQAIIVQHHLHRLVEGIKQPNASGQDMYDYLVNAWPEVLDALEKFTKEQLLIFFKSREMQMQQFGCDVLADVGDDPRLPKMIEDFLRIANEESSQESGKSETVASTAAI
jgi:hypothetical protein